MSLTIHPAKIVEESNSPLLGAPEAWPRRPLGDVAKILNGYAFKSSQFVAGGGMPLIRIRDIFRQQTVVGYTGHFEDRFIIRSGDLLVGMDGDFNCTRWRGGDALLNQRVCKITPLTDCLDIEYLTLILPAYLQAIHEVTSSTTVTHLSSRDLAEIPIPVPPLADQRALVACTKAVSEKAATIAAHLNRSRQAVGFFREAVVAAACSGRLTEDWRLRYKPPSSVQALVRQRGTRRENERKKYRAFDIAAASSLPLIPEEWSWAALPELGELGRGKSKHRPRNDPSLYGGKYPFIQTGDVARSGGRITEHSQTYNEQGLAQSRIWPERTVCITIAANIADSALLTYPACFPDSVVGLIADDSLVLPEYIELFIRTARRDLSAFAPATAQANINLAILSELAVPVPPLSEQREIISKVSNLHELADGITARINEADRRVERSAASVLAKALRGELAVEAHAA